MNSFFFDPQQAEALIWGTHDYSLVGLSLLVSVGASCVAMQLAGLAQHAEKPLQRQIALASGAFALGAGIWAVHFLGMLAFDLCQTVTFDPIWTTLSLLPALGASWVALNQLAKPRVTWHEVMPAGILMGAGISAMHYAGMAGMVMQAKLKYDPWWFAASILMAMLLSMFALWLKFVLHQNPALQPRLQTSLAGAVTGLAIACMHYLGMAAARFGGEAEIAYVPVSPHLALNITLVVCLMLLVAGGANALLAFLQTVRQLKSEQARLRAVMDTAVDGFITIDSMGRIHTVNQATQKIFGWLPQEMAGQNVNMLMPEPHRSGHDGYLTHCLETGDERVIGKGREVMAQHKDGRLFPIRLSVGRTKLDDQHFFVGIVTDITEEREAQRRERDAKSEVLSFMNALTKHSIFSETDSKGNIIRANEACVAITGYSKAELIGRSYRMLNSGVHPPEFWAQMWQTIQSGKPWRGEICNVNQDGQRFWVDSLIAPVVDDRGQIRRIMAIQHDITSRKTHDTLLRNTQQALEMSNLASRTGTLEYDVVRRELRLSTLARELLKTHLLCAPPTLKETLAQVRQKEALVLAIEVAMKHGQSWDLEIQVAAASGEDQWRRVIGQSEIHNGLCTRVYGTVQDIDSSKRRELELAQAREAAEAASLSKDLFLATISDELRTPMNAIIGFGQTLEVDKLLNGDQAASVQEILKAGRHLLDLINDVLDLAKINAGKLALANMPRLSRIDDNPVNLKLMRRMLNQQDRSRLETAQSPESGIALALGNQVLDVQELHKTVQECLDSREQTEQRP